MKCEQCGRDIKATNTFSVNYCGRSYKICGRHYAQFLRYHAFLDAIPYSNKEENEYELCDMGVWVITRDRKYNESGRFLIDKDDLDRVIIKRWRRWRNRYYTGNFHPVTIARFITNCPNDKVVDHINGNAADNRKSNLLICTQHENAINRGIQSNNTTGMAGVVYDQKRDCWSAEIMYNKTKYYLGRYGTKCDAVYARYIAERFLFGNYRCDRNDKDINTCIQNISNELRIRAYVLDRLKQVYPNLNWQ